MTKNEELYYHDINKIAKSLEQIAKALNQPKNETSNENPNTILEELKDAIKWCCYDGKSLGRYETHFKELEKQLKVLNVLKNYIVINGEDDNEKWLSFDRLIDNYDIYCANDYYLIERWLNDEI